MYDPLPPVALKVTPPRGGVENVAGVMAVAAVQLPGGNPGLLGIGADSTGPGTGQNGFTVDSFATPTIVASFLDMGINIGQDNTHTSSCKQQDRKLHGRLRCQNVGSAGEPTPYSRTSPTMPTTVKPVRSPSMLPN